MKVKANLLATGLLAGTIIGAGVFSLPYIFRQSGFLTGIFYLVLAVATLYFVYWMYAQIISRTPGEHRFVGYTKIYLGKWMSRLAILMTIVGMVLVLTIYLILSQSFAELITSFGHGVEKMIVFWFLGSVAIFMTARKLAWLEFLVAAGMIAIIVLIFFLGLPNLGQAINSSFLPNAGMLLLPLGPVLFALAGRVAIPPLVKISGPAKGPIFWGTAIPAIVYVIFVLSVFSLSPFITEDAVSGLIGGVSPPVLMAIGILGILSLITSYIAIGFDVARSLALDMNFPFGLQFLIVVFGPLALYFAGLQSFIVLVSLTGGIFLGLEAIFIIWMWLKMTKKKLSIPIVLLGLVFVAAVVNEILR